MTLPVLDRPLFWATAYVTVPLPLPLVPDVIVIDGTLLCVLHEQSLSVDTLIETIPPV